ncbi:MAG: hypothetical protein K2I79_02380 [Clostridia bacterium]|nr:hypothetical protein [Clostridia bacterium]
MINGKALKSLEYDKVLSEVAGYCSGECAAAAMRAFTPAEDYDGATLLINLTCEADKILYEHCVSPDFGFSPITDCLEYAIKGSVLSVAQIKTVGMALRTARLVRKAIDSINDGEIKYITQICSELVTDSALESNIADSISGDNELSDNASSELRRIRHALKGANDAVRSKLNSYLSGEQSKYLQDNLITMRSGRYVLPVKAECRSAIQGLLHDRSASGATLYIEPYAVVELNNEVKALAAQENAEIERILMFFTSEIASKSLIIEQACNIVTRLDCIFARAKYARATRAVKPIINNNGYIKIIKGRHPLLDKDKVVPVSLELGSEYSVMIISGPNTGGKPVTLKMCGLFTLMASSGLFVPCLEGSELSYFDAVYCDIGDAQSIERNLSTFSSHMLNISQILTCADRKSLVLLDEVGAGTDPQEGGALAVACIEYLFNKGCRCIATSHYDELKVYSAQTQGICNASMDFEPSTYLPTYRLITGIAGASNALETAANLGLPDSVIRRAYGMISPDKIKINALVKSA